ncbi:hypothetical protein DVJ77_19495 [Dyella tabacisoli]|uniref:Uncharacterized protein n=1 Tax=Dyella tabacisoli TaxID=2282381 RepID=A0A369UK12_9GAMM|nr:hypothetical protein DVJ77_19495 [Dyella tabacisoli]
MHEHAYLVGGIVLSVVALVAVYLIQTRHRQAGSKRFLASYFLLWSLIFDADKTRRDGHFLSSREWIGWVVAILIVVGILVSSSSRAP